MKPGRLRLGLRLGLLTETAAVAMYRAEARALGDGLLGRRIAAFALDEGHHATGLEELLRRAGGRPFPDLVQRIGAALTAAAGAGLACARPATLLRADRMVERWGLALYAWTLRQAGGAEPFATSLEAMQRQEREHEAWCQEWLAAGRRDPGQAPATGPTTSDLGVATLRRRPGGPRAWVLSAAASAPSSPGRARSAAPCPRP